jgi:hypothetical protein
MAESGAEDVPQTGRTCTAVVDDLATELGNTL